MQYQMQVDPARRGFRSAVPAILLVAMSGCSNDHEGLPAQPPIINLSVDTNSVSMGDSVMLSWSTSGAESCSAQADWTGAKQANGQETVGPLETSSRFTLSCDGPGGTSSELVSVIVAPLSGAPPTVAMAGLPTSVDYSGTTVLSWSSTDAVDCTASGDWTGQKATAGSESIAGLTATSKFILTCSGAAGSASQSVTVSVVSVAADPVVSFSASPASVDPGGSVTLIWEGTDVDSCAASGGWSGARVVNGSEVVGPIDQDTTFSLSCTGPGATTIAITTVQVRVVRLRWDAPTENVDGSPLTDLSGFRVYYGGGPRSYDGSIEVADPMATELALNISPGTSYFAVTAYDADGDESELSNEVSKEIH